MANKGENMRTQLFSTTHNHTYNHKLLNSNHVCGGRADEMNLLLEFECEDVFVESGYLANTTVTSNFRLDVIFSPLWS